MGGFTNKNGQSIVYADNVDFSGQQFPENKVTTNGQLLIGSSVAPYIRVNNLTQGTGMSISNGNGTITLAVSAETPLSFSTDSGSAVPASNILTIAGLSGSKTSGSGSTVTVKSPPFSQVGSTATSSLNTGEFVTAAVTRTLPATAGLADGDLVIYYCTTASALVITANTGQTIRVGTLVSSSAGTCTSTAIGDSITLRFDATAVSWRAVSVIGTWLIA